MGEQVVQVRLLLLVVGLAGSVRDRQREREKMDTDTDCVFSVSQPEVKNEFASKLHKVHLLILFKSHRCCSSPFGYNSNNNNLINNTPR